MNPYSRQSPVYVSVSAAEQVPVRGAQVPVKESVNEGIHQRVGVAEPQQRPLQPNGYAATLHPTYERSRCGQNEKRQPANPEHADYHAQGRGCLLLPLKDGDVLSLAAQQSGKSGALLGDAGLRFEPLHPQRIAGHRLQAIAAREVGEAVLGAALSGGLEDLVVHEEHDDHGDVEGHGGGVDGVAEVLADQTDAGRVDVLRPPAERRQSDGGGHQPHPEDHFRHELAVLARRVGQRAGDAKIPAVETKNIAMKNIEV